MQELYQYLGSFRLYQFFLCLMGCTANFLLGCQMLAFTWTGYAPNVRCRIPALDGFDETNYSQPFDKNIWYPSPTDKGQFCRYCPSLAPENGTNCTNSLSIPCNFGHIFDSKSLIPNSLTILLDLACENVWKRQLIFSLPTVGFMLGLAVLSPISDKYGRRPVVLFNTVGLILCCFALPAAENYYAYAILETLVGALNTGVYTTIFILFVEMIDGPARVYGGIICSSFAFPFGLLYLCLVAYAVPDWKYIQLLAAAPSLFLIPCFWLPESLRWLILHGKIEKAKETIRTAAKVNGVLVPEAVIHRHIEHSRSTISVESQKATLLDLFKEFSLGKNTLIVFYIWFSSSMAYYGLAQNTQDLPGNAYMTNALSAVVELPGYIIVMPLLSHWGRRPTVIAAMALGGAGALLAGLVNSKLPVLIMALVGKMCISAAFAVAYIYSSEIFPTVVRQSGLGYGSACARIGSVLAPQIRLLGNFVVFWLPIVIYGAGALIGAVAAFFLPETKGMRLPESIADSVHISSLYEENEKELLQEKNRAIPNYGTDNS